VCHLGNLKDAARAAKSHHVRCQMSDTHGWMLDVMDAGIRAGAAQAGCTEGIHRIAIRFADGAVRHFLVAATDPDMHGTSTLVIAHDAHVDGAVEHDMFSRADWIEEPGVARQVIQGPAGSKAVACSKRSQGITMRIDVKTHMHVTYYHLMNGEPRV
jgi:hypothetical protein